MSWNTEKIKEPSCRIEERFRQFIADTPLPRLRNYMVVVYGIITLAIGIVGIIAINFTWYLALLVLEKLI